MTDAPSLLRVNVTLLTFFRCVLEHTLWLLHDAPVEKVPLKSDPSLLTTRMVQFFPLLIMLASSVGPPPVPGSVGDAVPDALSLAESSSVTVKVTL